MSEPPWASKQEPWRDKPFVNYPPLQPGSRACPTERSARNRNPFGYSWMPRTWVYNSVILRVYSPPPFFCKRAQRFQNDPPSFYLPSAVAHSNGLIVKLLLPI